MLVGAQQGGLIVLLSSLPLVVEAALCGRVFAEVELADARNTWVAIEGFVGIEPSIQGTYTDVAFLCQAVPEAFEPQRKLRPGVLVASTQGQQRSVTFWNGPGEVLAFVRVLSLSEAVPFRENLYSAYPERLAEGRYTVRAFPKRRVVLPIRTSSESAGRALLCALRSRPRWPWRSVFWALKTRKATIHGPASRAAPRSLLLRGLWGLIPVAGTFSPSR